MAFLAVNSNGDEVGFVKKPERYIEKEYEGSYNHVPAGHTRRMRTAANGDFREKKQVH